MAQNGHTCSHRRSGGTGISDLIRERNARDAAVNRAVKEIDQRYALNHVASSRRLIELERENANLRSKLAELDPKKGK